MTAEPGNDPAAGEDPPPAAAGAEPGQRSIRDGGGHSGGEAGPRRRRAIAFPTLRDLRPYYDIRDVAKLGPDAAALLRLTWRCARFLGRGLGALAVGLTEWTTGRRGKGPAVPGRLGITAFCGYAAVRTPTSHPAALWGEAGAAVVAAALAAAGRFPGIDAAQNSPEKARKGTAKRLIGRPRPAPEAFAPEPPSEPEADADEPPAEDALTALLRDLIGNDNGVHLQVLRPAMRERLPGLSEATDQELRQVLVDAGYDPSRTFRAGGFAGRSGVHRDELPPLPSPKAPSASALRRAKSPRPAKTREAESARRMPEEGAESGPRIVPDPENGPNAWRIDHPGGPTKPPRKRPR